MNKTLCRMVWTGTSNTFWTIGMAYLCTGCSSDKFLVTQAYPPGHEGECHGCGRTGFHFTTNWCVEPISNHERIDNLLKEEP